VRVAEGAGDGSGRSTGIQPGALTALLQEVAATPGKRDEEPQSLPPGTVVGRFEIIRELGHGGFGVVYEARDRDLGRQVAVKVVRPGRITEEEGKVSREAEAIARLAHPNLITLHEVGRSDHGPFLVFELLRGKTLDLRIEEGPLPIQEAVHIATEVARGLAHAHAEGVIHRDLKPANVFVTNKGQVKILDFGMAHAFGRRRLSGGTPAYMAPEQWEDAPEDERTDVFALGVMLYRMLTGDYPFPEGKGRWAAEPATVRKLDVPGAPDLAALVEKMLDPVPTRRPRDGAAVLAALTLIEDKLRAKPADGSPPVHAKRRKATFGDLLAELRRRHVFRVMIGYGVAAFAVLQVTEPIMHGADLPAWVLKAVLVALALGFPVAVVLAWAYDLTAQGVKRTPSTTDPGAPRFGRSRLLLPLAVSAAVLAIATAGAGAWYAWKGASGGRHPGASVPVAGPDGRIMVAVADFVNDTKDPDLDGLSSQLITSLEQSQKLRVLTRSRMVDVLRQLGKATVPVVDEVMGREMARAAGVQALVVASIRRFDQLYSIDLKVLDPTTSEYFFTLKEQREGKAAIPDMLDRLSEKAREKLRETPAEVGASRIEVAKATTKDYEAWQHYFAGQKLEDAGEDEDAVLEYTKAVAEDPRFALAHYRIAYLGRWLVTGEARNAAMAAALREIDRVPAKERLLILAQKAKMDGRPGDAHALYERAAEAYPQDKEVLFLAGEMYAEEQRWAEALPWFERVRTLDPVRADANEWMIYDVLPKLGKHEESLLLAREWAEKAPGTRSQSTLVIALIRAGRPSEAVDAARRLVTIAPGPTIRWLLASALFAADRFEEAETFLEPFVQVTATPRDRRDSLIPYAAALALQGRRREAMAAMATWESIPVAADYPAEPWFPFNRWILKVDERDPGPGMREAAGLRRKRDGKHSHAVYLLLPVLGDDAGAAQAVAGMDKGQDRELHDAIAAWRRGDSDDALTRIRSIIARYPLMDSLGHWWLAYVAFDARQDELALRAVESYERVPWQPIPLGMWRPWGLGRLLYKKALAQDRMGDQAGAVATVERMLAMWKKADPDLPMLAETRALCRKFGCKAPE
jgi:tetratricopeptide (TPR) repeat protein